MRRALISALLVALAGFALTGCKPAVHGEVLFVGDSNIVNGAAATVNALSNVEDGYIATFAATTTSTIRFPDCASSLPPGTSCTTYNFWKVRLSQTFTKMQPDAVVIDLGINDAGALGDPNGEGYSNYDAKIDWLMGLIPPTTPILWSNLPCVVEPTASQAGCTVIDLALAAAPSRWPNLRIVDWASIANTHPEWMDGVHMNATGYTNYANTIGAALNHLLPAPADDSTTSTTTVTP